MKKTQTIRLSAEDYRLMLYSLGFANGALRQACQFEVADALTQLVRTLQKQEKPPAAPVLKVRKVG